MQMINIGINNAKLQNYHIYFNDDNKLQASATIGLYMGTKKISEFSICTDTWDENRKFILPPKMIKPIMQIAKQIEEIVTLKCNESLALIQAPL